MALRDRLSTVQRIGLGETARVAWKRYVHDTTELGAWGVTVSDAIAPRPHEDDVHFDLLPENRWEETLDLNRYLTEDEVQKFRRANSSCIVAYEADRLVGTSWMVNDGPVWVPDLRSDIEVHDTEHFSCRTFVDPSQRGRSLMWRMLYYYTSLQASTDLVWGLIYDGNVASIRSVERLGWHRMGAFRMTSTLGIKNVTDDVVR